MSPPSCQTCGRTLTAAGPCPTCLFGLSADDARDTFAGLKLEDELGRGGMGTVFRATQVTLGRSVAVKFLAPELGQTSEGRARFEREAKALALLDHPHIVRVHDFGIEDGESYLVMELVEGGDVTKRVPMTVGEAVACARQVCDALGYAHERGVIHRDIKPQNVLLDERGQAKVTDFGIARVTRGDGQAWPVTAPDVRVGSVGFMAPEMMSGGPVTPRLDVYSVGALVRALVTGRAPVGETHELPERLEAVVRRAMAERPEDRFATMADLSAALALAVAPTGPTLGAQPRAPQGFTPLPEDERLWLHAVAFVQTLAVAAVLWAGLLSLSPRTQQPSDLTPLTSFSRQVVDGEHVMTRARFETGAVLLAVVALALAFAATGWLKRHWRLEGLDSPAPEQPLPYTRHVWWLGVIAALSYGLRVWLAPSAASVPWLVFLPFFGGVMELAVLYFTVWSVLEGSRRRRPLTREPWLWAGQLLALIPPVTEFVRSV